MTERRILWTVSDPRGSKITLSDDVWREIVRKHQDMASHFDAVRIAAQDPDEIYYAPKSTASRTTGAKIYRYYKIKLLSGTLADKFTVVVVKAVSEADGIAGYVETAFPSERIQKRLVLEWKK